MADVIISYFPTLGVDRMGQFNIAPIRAPHTCLSMPWVQKDVPRGAAAPARVLEHCLLQHVAWGLNFQTTACPMGTSTGPYASNLCF